MQRAGEKGKSIPSRWNSPEGSGNLAPGRNGGGAVCRGRTYVAGPVDGGRETERRWGGRGQGPVPCSDDTGKPGSFKPRAVQCDFCFKMRYSVENGVTVKTDNFGEGDRLATAQ